MSQDHALELRHALERVFEDTCTASDRQDAEATGWMPECWRTLEETGLAWVGVPEEIGGSGGDAADAFALLSAAGRYAVPLPLAEGVLLGGWLLAQAGLALPGGPVSVPVPRPDDHLVLTGDRIDGVLSRVPWARRCSAVVALADTDGGPRVVLLDPAAARVTDGRSLAGEPRERLEFAGVRLDPARIGGPTSDLREELALRGALSRALLMAGAMDAITARTIGYAGERRQFGKPIASFQAVGHRIVRLAAEAELAQSAAAVAATRFAESGVGAAFEVAAAKTTVSRAAGEVAAQAHQVHGAIGMTQEYPLHHFTRRLWAWRLEWGSQSRWARTLGRQAEAIGAERLWSRVATGLVASESA